jgi:hypothetical protein
MLWGVIKNGIAALGIGSWNTGLSLSMFIWMQNHGASERTTALAMFVNLLCFGLVTFRVYSDKKAPR